MLSPKIALAITEHSICQPGRPGPQGDGHAGSPAFDPFQRAKSEGDRLPFCVAKEPMKMCQEKKGSIIATTNLRLLQATLGCPYSKARVLRSNVLQLCQRLSC